jgi:hypothetical protein
VPNGEHIVAIGLLTRRDLDVLCTGFQRMFPLQDSAEFIDILERLEEVSQRTRRPH